MAELVGFEPTISRSTGGRFKPLSYSSIGKPARNRTQTKGFGIPCATTTPLEYLGWMFGSAPNLRPSQGPVLLLHYKHHVKNKTGALVRSCAELTSLQD